MEMTNHILYRMLKFAFEKEGGYFTIKEISDYLGRDFDEDYFATLVAIRGSDRTNKVFYGFERIENNGNYTGRKSTMRAFIPRKIIDDPEKYPFALLPEAAARYMEMLELKEARQAAKEAKILSWIAIGISLVLGTAQVYVGLTT